jgi:hypothetical protein
MFELTNGNSWVHVCHAALDADTFTASEAHSIGVIGSGEGTSFSTDQLPGSCAVIIIVELDFRGAACLHE